jgi:hypothetical protein
MRSLVSVCRSDAPNRSVHGESLERPRVELPSEIIPCFESYEREENVALHLHLYVKRRMSNRHFSGVAFLQVSAKLVE